jgi:hypothetical protein
MRNDQFPPVVGTAVTLVINGDADDPTLIGPLMATAAVGSEMLMDPSASARAIR